MRAYIPFDDGSVVSFDGKKFTIHRQPVEIDADLDSLSEGQAAQAWRGRRGDVAKALETAWWKQHEHLKEKETKRIYSDREFARTKIKGLSAVGKTVLHEVAALGQSLWLDFISRELLLSKELEDWVQNGILGVTTNPSIFEQAIAKTADYDAEICDLAEKGRSAAEIYEHLTLQEVGAAADILRPVYDETGGLDGYVSLEVNPLLASDVSSTVSEAGRLFKALNRPNVMIKIPSTPEGVEAVETCIGMGINVNATLIFSVEQYASIAEAYVRGLEKRVQNGQSPKVASVASVFVSRIDAAVDAAIDTATTSSSKAGDALSVLKGHIAIDNARMTYRRFKEIFSATNVRWEKLAEKGARVQRPLWASTGTKDPAYSDVLYVESLIGPDTVDTVPPKTLSAFWDHGKAKPTIEDDLAGAHRRLEDLAKMDIDLRSVCSKLLKDGVESFNVAFVSLMKGIERKAKRYAEPKSVD